MRRSKVLGAAVIGSGSTTLCTAGAGNFIIVKNLIWRNYGSGAVLCTVTFPNPSGSDFGGLDIWAAGGGVQWGGGGMWTYIVLAAGKSLKAAGGNGSFALSAFGVELPE
jgi:hypothetical protein